MGYIIGLDAGTTCFKAGLYDSSLRQVAFASEDYELEYTPEGFVEFEPEGYWQLTCRLLHRLLQQSAVSPRDVDGIGISSQGETLLFLDENGRPLRRAMIWTDGRAVEEKAALQRLYSDETIFAVTGQREITAGWPASKWLWVKNHQPEIAEKTRHLLLLGDYLAYRFTGQYATTRCLSTSTLYMDIHSGSWWPEMLETLELPEELLPRLLNSTDRVGSLTPEAARQTGLTTDTVVVGGAFDQAAGMLGSGNITPGMLSETTGTCLAVCANLGGLVPSFDQGHLPVHYGIRPQDYYAIYWSGAAGSILRWARETFYSDDTSPAVFSHMDAEASSVSPGADGLSLLPYFSGVNYPSAVEDATGTALGLSLFHRRRHFVRATLESVAFLLRQSLEELEGYGLTPGQIHSLGGGAVSQIWCQIKADMTGCELVVSERQEETCFGAALLAAVGTGLYPSCEAALLAGRMAEKRYQPRQTEAYEEVYQRISRQAQDYYQQAMIRCNEKERSNENVSMV